MTRVLCALSGGVDSSVAAALIREEGHEVIGVFLRLGPGGDLPAARTGSCCSVADSRDASRVADRLGIPFYALNYREEFERIIGYFVEEYNRGRTPNPCARCNQWVKFGSLLELATALGCDRLATGHYARIRPAAEAGERAQLLRGSDRGKDQSYFLFSVPAAALKRTYFPVGGRTKAETRELARRFDLPVADKPDSQEICFVPGGDYRSVIASRTPGSLRPGRLVDAGGAEIGEHAGHQHFTIGQRRGLKRGFGEPRYVIGIDPSSNTVTVGPRSLLCSSRFDVEEVNWVSMEEPAEGADLRAEVQIRHRAGTVPARVTSTGSGSARVELEEPREAVTPGQAAVFYRGDVLLGGGWIANPS